MNLAKNSFPFWIFCHINLRPLRVNADLGARRTHLADNFVLFATSLCLGTIYGQAMTISNSSLITMAIVAHIAVLALDKSLSIMVNQKVAFKPESDFQ